MINEILDFLQFLKRKYKTAKFDRWLFVAEARANGWSRYEINKCLVELHRQGKIAIGKNNEIILRE